MGGIRWDSHMYEGYLFPPYYDALMAKIVAYGDDRHSALARASAAVARLDVEGPVTNASLLRKLLADRAIVENSVTTTWLEDQFARRALP
jgi:acetyl-CoA carboxylase biotin carboxylase subunit